MFCLCDRDEWGDQWEQWVLVTKRTKIVRKRTVPAKYSYVRCLLCGASWKTAASYVDVLPNGQTLWSVETQQVDG